MDGRTPISLLRSVREELIAVQKKVDYLVAVLDSQKEDSVSQTSGHPRSEQSLALNVINQALLEMTAKESQEEILDVLLQRASECADRVILFDSENGKLQAWKGLGIGTEELSLVIDLESDTPLQEAVRSGRVISVDYRIEETLPWLSRPDYSPASCLWVPLAFGAYIPLVLYADSASAINSGTLELLGRLAVLQLQNQYLAHLLHTGEDHYESPPQEGLTDESVDLQGDEPVGEFERKAELVENEGEAVDLMSLTAEEEEAAHGEARRLARLLVAEIKLYNEDEVAEGRKHSDLYRRLRTDIERSRKMYEKLVHPLVQLQTDYYGAEMVRVLAMDDPKLMGDEYESSEVANPIRQEGD